MPNNNQLRRSAVVGACLLCGCLNVQQVLAQLNTTAARKPTQEQKAKRQRAHQEKHASGERATASTPRLSNAVYLGCTAGTVRVDNLANVEAFLNAFANLSAVVGLIASGWMVYKAMTLDPALQQGSPKIRRKRLGTAAVVGIASLSLHSCLSRMVTVMRELNLFG